MASRKLDWGVRALILTQRPRPGIFAEVLVEGAVAQPSPRSREVVVRVVASSINIDDIHVAEGTFYGGIPVGPRPRRDRPVIPGSDLAGVVVAVGERVRSLTVGDEVFGMQLPLRRGGAWAEFCAMDERWVAKKPANVSHESAAAAGVSGLVALYGIGALGLRPGVRVVIVGATGGIGSMAVQMAVRAGAKVIGVCGTRNVERAYRLGCSLVVDYRGGPWDEALRAAGRVPVDRVLDLVGGRDTEEMAKRVLPRDGVFVTVVGPERFIGDRRLGWRRIAGILAHVGYRMAGSRVRGPRYVLTGPGAGAGRALAEVARYLAAGVLPQIDLSVPFELDAIRQALRRAAAHENQGRIVIQVGRES